MRILAASSIIASSTIISSCADGSALRTGPVMVPTSFENVRVLLEKPNAKYVSLGLVEAEMDEAFLTSTEKTAEKALKELKVQAAKLGANAVIVKNYSSDSKADAALIFDNSYSGIVNTDVKRLSGIAIKLK